MANIKKGCLIESGCIVKHDSFQLKLHMNHRCNWRWNFKNTCPVFKQQALKLYTRRMWCDDRVRIATVCFSFFSLQRTALHIHLDHTGRVVSIKLPVGFEPNRAFVILSGQAESPTQPSRSYCASDAAEHLLQLHSDRSSTIVALSFCFSRTQIKRCEEARSKFKSLKGRKWQTLNF